MSRRYPSRPVVGVGAIITRGDEVLLVRRGREPQKGIWSVPGGVLHVGETLEEGVRREVREEVGLDVRVVERVEVLERILPDAAGKLEYHYILIDYLCEPTGGTLQAADDAAEAAWVDRSDFDDYEITPGTIEVINGAFEARDRLARAIEGG
jgi:8-oxo-dGTP diphosphatase